jgi:hypothetical protein
VFIKFTHEFSEILNKVPLYVELCFQPKDFLSRSQILEGHINSSESPVLQNGTFSIKYSIKVFSVQISVT